MDHFRAVVGWAASILTGNNARMSFTEKHRNRFSRRTDRWLDFNFDGYRYLLPSMFNTSNPFAESSQNYGIMPMAG
jgi:hypothetical protein